MNAFKPAFPLLNVSERDVVNMDLRVFVGFQQFQLLTSPTCALFALSDHAFRKQRRSAGAPVVRWCKYPERFTFETHIKATQHAISLIRRYLCKNLHEEVWDGDGDGAQ
ncbi:uncharacterized protein V6R79_018250 [Siganus canaliculatus]